MNLFKQNNIYVYSRGSIKSGAGFTLVEMLVGTALFVVLVMSVYGAYKAVYDVIADSRFKVAAIDLATEQLELARNLPYNSVGILGGLPTGLLTHSQTIVRDSTSYIVVTTVRNVDDPFDGSLPTDTSPDDYKIVQVEVDCALCKAFQPVVLTSQIAPKYLETSAANGALIINAFDSNGHPISQANIHIVDNQASPTITIDDVTNNSGMLEEVDAPPGQNAYAITVTKSGYTTDQTYATSSVNINPTKPHATVLLQQASTASFVIDKVSTVSVASVDEDCNAVPSVAFNMTGSKTIGTSPIIYKYNQSLNTGGTGTLNLSNMEWDSYTLSLTDPTYELIGANPLIPVAVAPNSTQNIQLIVEPKNPDTVLVTVKDSSTGLPVSGATVQLLTAGNAVSATRITGQGFFSQTDWSGGSGQATSTAGTTKYLSSDGNIVVNNPVGGIILRSSLGQYVTDGSLISSSFDTSGVSNFGNMVWSPQDQATSTGSIAVRFQIATNNNGGTWNFLGPDGTSGTYYTLANTNIAALNNGNRYLRYKLFLHTADQTKTPNISDIAFTFTSACAPPGQVSFSNLSAGNYTIQITASGYQTATVPITVSSAWQGVSVTLLP